MSVDSVLLDHNDSSSVNDGVSSSSVDSDLVSPFFNGVNVASA